MPKQSNMMKREASFDGRKFQDLRRRAGLSSADVAAREVCRRGCYISAVHLARIEAGHVPHVTTDILLALASLVGVQASDLLRS